MKARYGCALGLLAGVCLIGSAQAQSIVVGPQAGSMAVVPGALVTVPIVADMTGSGGRSLGSVAAQLVWRPGVLAFQGVGAGALGAPVVNADSAAGTLRFALANPTGVTGQSVLLNAVFAVVGAPGATDTLRLTLQELTNAGTFLDLLSIGHAMNASVCVSTGLFGDLDQSGTIDGFDALVILTDAVGLPIAPRTTVNGDVDGDGHVSTRDALVVLSYAVGLPVGGFRVGRLNPGGCTIRMAASVQVTPQTVAVTSGDRVPLAAVVRDSAGVAIQGMDLLWTSADTTIAKTDAAGTVVAMGPGTTRVYAIVAPGLKDSVTVSVSATRHVWYVDLALAAQNGGVELGSSLYPFSGIAQALARAAANDSVMIAPATYGEGVRLTVPLILVGDSTAAGATTIRNATGTGIVVDSVGSGLVRLDRLHIDDSQGGIIVRGAGTAVVVDLKGVTVARSRGVGISVRRVDRLLLDHVTVQGAVDQGIEVDSVPKVYAHAVLVDGISEQTGIPRAVRVAWADSVVADSLFVFTAGVRLDSVVAASFDGFTGRDVHGPAIEAYVRSAFMLDRGDITGTAEVDIARGESPYSAALMLGLGDPAGTARFANTTIHDNGRPALGTGGGDSVLVSRLSVSNSPWRQTPIPWTVAFEGQRRVAVEYSDFADNNGAHVGFEHYEGLMSASVDSCTFQGTALRGQHLVAMDVLRSRFRDTPESAVQADNVGTVSLVQPDIRAPTGPGLRVNGGQHLSVRGGRIAGPDTTLLQVNSTAVVGLNNIEITGASGVFPDTSGGSFAVRVLRADSVALDSLWIHDNGAGAIRVDTARVILMRWSRIEDNHLALPDATPAKAVRLEGFRRVRITQSVVDLGAAASVSQGYYLQGVAATFGPLGGARVQVDSSTFLGGRAVYVRAASRLLHDTLGLIGLRATPAMTSRTLGVYALNVGFLEAKGIEVDSSSWGATGLAAYYTGGFDVQNSRFTHTGWAVGITADTVYVGSTTTHPGPGVFSGNTIECDSAVSAAQYVVSLGSVAPATVTNNVLQGHCGLGIVASNSAVGAPQGLAVMTDNWVSSSSSGPPFVTGGTMLSLQGAYRNALVARNTTAPGAITFHQNTSTLGMDSTRIEENTVRGNWRGGIYLFGNLRATTLRGNVVDSVPSNANYAAIYMGIVTAGTTTRLIGNTIRRALKDGISLPATDTTLLDSNVIVDSRAAVVVNSAKVVGRWNFIARDSVGLSGSAGSFVRMDSSVIMQSITGWGANNSGATPWELQANYWGDPLGPRCLSGCNALSTGDSILGPATTLSFTQFLTSAPVSVPAGAPPAFRAASPLTARIGAPFLSAGATRAVMPAARSGRSRPRPVRRASSPTPALDPLLLPQLPEVIW